MSPQKFRNTVWDYYRAYGRKTLPWRMSHDPYRVWISEIMLQQTQVDRVIPYFKKWIRTYPTVRALAKAPLGEVLTHWQGLGYNRRAKMLHEAAKAVVERCGGKMPMSVEALESLPGVGHYTARAVAAFAYNQDVVFIETNIRTAIIHHFFPEQDRITDLEIMHVLQKVLPKGKARDWYAALMDYGSHLKRSGIRTNAKSTGYTKQQTFKGSGREVRGTILRTLTKAKKSEKYFLSLFPAERSSQVTDLLDQLLKEGMITKSRSLYSLPL